MSRNRIFVLTDAGLITVVIADYVAAQTVEAMRLPGVR